MVDFLTSRVMPQARQASPISTSTADALTQLGGTMQGVADKFTEFFEKEARIQNELLLAKTEAEWSRRFKEASQNAGRGFSGQIVQEFDAYRTEVMQTAPKRGRDEVNLALDKYRIGLEERAINAELAAAARAANAAAAEGANLRLNNLLSNPTEDLLSQYMTEHPEQAGDYVRAYNSARMMTTPEAVLEEMQAGTWDAFITPAQKLTFLEAGVSAVARQDRERQAELAVEQANLAAAGDEIIAYAQANGAPPLDAPDVVEAARLIMPPDQADAFIAEYETSLSAAQMTHNVGVMTPEQIDAAIMEFDARVAAPGRSAADATERNQFLQALVARNQAISTDAAGHAVRINDEVAANYAQTRSEDAETRRIAAANYVAAIDGVNGEYDRLGVPPEMRRLLPVSDAKQIVNGLLSGGTDVAAQTLAGIRADWNNDPRLVRELQEAGLPPEYVSAMRNADNPGLAAAIIGTAAVPIAELKTGIAPDRVRAVDERMVSGLEDYAVAFTAGDVTGDAAKAFAAEYAIAEKLILQAVKSGQNESEATDRILSQMFPGEVVNTSEMKLLLPEGVPAMAAEWTLEGYMTEANIRAFGPEPLIGPPDENGNPSLAAVDLEVTIASAADTGIWLNNGDNSGAVLHLNVSGYYLPLRNSKGEYYTVPFANIKTPTFNVGPLTLKRTF